MRLIDTDAIEEDYDEELYTDYIDDYAKGFQAGLWAVINQPTIEPYGTWIPVSSGELPKEPLKSVIGWDEYRKRCVFVRYNGREWILGDYESVKIIAWMPTPSPFREEKKDE